MKSLLIAVFLILFGFEVFPQSSFTSTYGTVRDEMPICISELGSNYIVSINMCNLPFGDLWCGTKILCIDKNGVVYRELTYDIADSNYFSITSITPINDTEFIAVGSCKSKLLPVSQFWIMKMDSALNIIWEKKYKTCQPWAGVPQVTQNTDGSYLIGSTLNSGSPLWYNSLMFLQMGGNGDSIQSSYFADGNPYFTYITDIMFINGQYKAFVRGFYEFVNSNCATQILQLDTNLNRTEVRPVPYYIEGTISSKKKSDSVYYLTGMSHFTIDKYDLSIAKLTYNEDSLAFNHTGSQGNFDDYSGWIKCMDFSNLNNIYVGGTANKIGSFYCTISDRVLMLSNYDSLLNCRWTRFYGSNACYTFNAMDATSDGGCIISGMYYDQDNPENLLDLIVIKVDSTGLFTSYPENQLVTSHEALIYPNPGFNVVSIQSGPQISGAEFSMYDASGNQVLNTALVSTIVQKDVSHLATGTYLWQIKFKGKIVDQGKWIKQ